MLMCIPNNQGSTELYYNFISIITLELYKYNNIGFFVYRNRPIVLSIHILLVLTRKTNNCYLTES